MSKKTDSFINGIAPIVVNEYLSRKKWILPSVCISQAALESGWNLNATTVFGIKGNDFKATTSEYYNGEKTTIEAGFKQFPDLSSSVVGYYDLITTNKIYSKCVNEPDYKKAVDGLINTGYGYGYATAPNYIESVISIIEQYDLTRFDKRPSEPASKPSEPVATFKEGDKVKVLKNTTYTGKSFRVYFDTYDVIEIKGDRAVIGIIGKGVTCAINTANIVKAAASEPVSKPSEPVATFKEGDKVKVLNKITYSGQPFKAYYGIYEVIEIDGDRAVIGVDGVVTCAINVANIKKV